MDDVRFSLGRGLVYPRRAGVELAPVGVGMRGARESWSLRGMGSLLDSAANVASEIWADWVDFAPLPSSLDRVRDAFVVLRSAEQQCIRTANAYIDRHNARRMSRAEYLEYDGLRHDLHDRQVAFHALLRASCYQVLGRSSGDQAIARVPWPGWFPVLRPESGRVAHVDASSLGAVQPIVIAAGVLALGILAAVLISNATDYTRESGATLVVEARAKALADAIAMRERLYADCVQRGGDSQSCMQTSTAATADAIAAVGQIQRQYGDEKRRRWLRIALPMGAGMAIVAGLAIWIKVRRKRHGRGLPANT